MTRLWLSKKLSLCFLNDCNIWPVEHDVLTFQRTFTLYNFFFLCKSSLEVEQLPPMSQPKSVPQLVLNTEFLTPTPIQPTRPCGEVSASSGDSHSHLWPPQRWRQGHFTDIDIGLPILFFFFLNAWIFI